MMRDIVIVFFLVLPIIYSKKSHASIRTTCVDVEARCEHWASVGECENNPKYMLVNCCKACKDDSEVDIAVQSGGKEDQVCANGDAFCEAAAVRADIPKGANVEGAARVVYKGNCKDRHSDQCVNWARNGECDRNPGWMIVNCPRSCNACHLLDPKVRCDRKTLNISNTPAYGPGDHSVMFSSLKEKFDAQYGVTVHSTEPWVVTFDNFITDDEVDALIKTQKKWERSTDTGKANDYGETGRILSSGRTSANSWCDSECISHPSVNRLTARIEEVVGIPRENYETFQVLRCE